MVGAVCKIYRRRAFATIHPFIYPFFRQFSSADSRESSGRSSHSTWQAASYHFSQINGRPHSSGCSAQDVLSPRYGTERDACKKSHDIWHPVVILPIVKTTIARHLPHATLLPPDACDAPITHSMLPPDDPKRRGVVGSPATKDICQRPEQLTTSGVSADNWLGSTAWASCGRRTSSFFVAVMVVAFLLAPSRLE